MEFSYLILSNEYTKTGVELQAVLPDERTEIGFTVLKPLDIHQGQLILDDLYVDKNYREKGVGRDLLECAIKTMKKYANYSSIVVYLQTANYESAEDALSRETQQRIMESLGFVECKDDSDASNIIAMKKILL